MKQTIIDSLQLRVFDEISGKSSLAYLKKYDVASYYDVLINTLYVFTRPRKGEKNSLVMFAETICGIGNRVRKFLNEPKDTALAARTGAFLLWTFEDMGMLRVTLTKGKKGHNQFYIELLDDEPLTILWKALPDEAVDRLPSTNPWPDWTSTRQETGERLIKTSDKDVLEQVTPEECPMIYDMINRAQRTPWRVNEKLLPVYDWCMRNKAQAFMDIWEAANKDAKATKLREVKTIADMAKRLKGRVFYHRYYLDFRFRKYPATAYLHEQGSDFARSLIYRADEEPMTREGFQWLQIYLAGNWAGDAGRLDKLKTDKIPIVDRIRWATANEDAMLGYAENPIQNQGWMNADSPWQFLAGCMELLKLRMWQLERGDMEDYSMPTGYEAYIDGSNNGCQHLAAMTRDEIVAPHVNLVPQALPGDLYRYVGQHVWENLAKSCEGYSKQQIMDCRWIIGEVRRLKEEDAEIKGRDERQAMHEDHKEFRVKHASLLKMAAPVYWLRFGDMKERRKLVKRNVMTIPYGGTAYGLGQQQQDDAHKHGITELRFMEKSWASHLGRTVYEDCRQSMARPMRLLGVFEAAGAAAEARGEFLRWRVPITNALVVQHYTEGVVKKTWIQYGPPVGPRSATGYYSNTYQIHLTYPEEQVMSKRKQASGAAPNGTHSCDAAHLTLTVAKCDFQVTTIHDSFGALLPRMPVLFKTVREAFLEFHEANPLQHILKDMQADIRNVSFGTLNLKLILDSEYAFL